MRQIRRNSPEIDMTKEFVRFGRSRKLTQYDDVAMRQFLQTAKVEIDQFLSNEPRIRGLAWEQYG